MEFTIDDNLAYFGRGGEYPKDREWYEVPDTDQPIPANADLSKLSEYGVDESDLEHRSEDNPVVDLSRLVYAARVRTGWI